jgi:hypothetical protein
MDAVMKLSEEAGKAGVMVEVGGLLPSAAGALVRITDGKLIITDGPFAETKEVVGGYAVYEVQTKQEAIDWATRLMALHQEHWPQWEGETELRQIVDCTDPTSACAK